MRTLFVADPPPLVEDWLARRRALGQDRFDEVWEGEYHVAPGPDGNHADVDHQLVAILGPLGKAAGLTGRTACNIGQPTDFRVPDQAYFPERTSLTWYPSAAIVVEVVSPGDESRRKLAFYHAVGVEELLLVDPGERTVEWFVRGTEAFRPADRSVALGITNQELWERIDWPA